MKAFLHNRRAMVGASVLVFFGLVAIFANLLCPDDPNNITYALMAPPSGQHLLGTTPGGQDILSQLIYGTRPTLVCGLLTGAIISLIQLVMGIFSGYAGGAIDAVLSTITNIFLVLPGLPLLIVIKSYTDSNSLTLMVVILSVTGWAWGARVLRSQAISLRDRPFTEAARMSGEGRWRIVTFNIVPNMFGILAANFFGAALYAVLSFSFLQFMGLANINEVAWGTMLYWAQNDNAQMMGQWVFLLVPGLCIVLLGTAFGLLNFAVDEVADPRLRRN